MTQGGADQGMRQLGEYIKLQRQMADLSLRRLAEMTSVSNAYLSQIERGLHQPSVRVLRSIAQALNVSADTLLGQAGLFDPPGPNATPRTSTEESILADPQLGEEEREALLRIYRSFVQARRPTGTG